MGWTETSRTRELVEENCLEVHDSPGVPGLVPAAVVLRGCSVVLQHRGDARLLQPLQRLLPAAKRIPLPPPTRLKSVARSSFTLAHQIYINCGLLIKDNTRTLRSRRGPTTKTNTANRHAHSRRPDRVVWIAAGTENKKMPHQRLRVACEQG